LIVLLCTGDFPGLHSRTPMIDARIDVEPLASGGRQLGVVLPTRKQIEEIDGAGYPADASFAHFAPHALGDREDELSAAAQAISSSHIVVMDCMAFDNNIRKRLRSKLNAPVILARDLLAERINQAISELEDRDQSALA
jgi:protein AroM